MNYLSIAKKLKELNLEVFTSQEFENVFGLTMGTAGVKLTRYKNKGYLVSPKKGVYYLADEPVDKFRIANRLYFPSYVSLDSILARNGVIPEIVYTVTSVTAKATREFQTEGTIFKYYRIKKAAYLGYRTEDNCQIATVEKALVDYLYFVAQGKRELNDRLNLGRVDKNQVFAYAQYFSNMRLNRLVDKILK